MGWLKEAIKSYVRDNSGKVDYADIASNFGLRSDITLKQVRILEEESVIERRHIFGFKHAEFYL